MKPVPVATQVVAELVELDATVAVAESLTGGGLTSELVAVPGTSAVLVGGLVAYATRVKADVLGVDAELLAAGGPVQAEVAAQMARGVSALLGADYGLATTGVAGPGAETGVPPGVVFVAATGPHRTWVRELHLAGTRRLLREASTARALALLLAVLAEDRDEDRGREQTGAGRS